MLATLQAKLIAAAVCLCLGAAGGGWLAWDIQGARLDHLKAADAAASEARLLQAQAESARALQVDQQSIGEQNAKIAELTTDRRNVVGLLTSLNDRIAHAPAIPSHCGPLRAQVEGQ